MSWYQVEVIVFDYSNPDLDREFWYENPGLPQLDDAIDPITSLPDEVEEITTEINQILPEDAGREDPEEEDLTEERVAYLALPQEKLRLQNDFRRLERLASYRPLLHVAWQQPGLEESRIRYVHLDKMEEVPAPIILPGPDLQVNPEDTELYTPPEPVFDGLVRLRTTSNLYIDVDFAYFPEDFPALLDRQLRRVGEQNEQLVNFDADYVRLKTSRRVWLNDLNYFDHPLFGILIQISRIDTG